MERRSLGGGRGGKSQCRCDVSWKTWQHVCAYGNEVVPTKGFCFVVAFLVFYSSDQSMIILIKEWSITSLKIAGMDENLCIAVIHWAMFCASKLHIVCHLHTYVHKSETLEWGTINSLKILLTNCVEHNFCVDIFMSQTEPGQTQNTTKNTNRSHILYSNVQVSRAEWYARRAVITLWYWQSVLTCT